MTRPRNSKRERIRRTAPLVALSLDKLIDNKSLSLVGPFALLVVPRPATEYRRFGIVDTNEDETALHLLLVLRELTCIYARYSSCSESTFSAAEV
jgi:hypothetical protein